MVILEAKEITKRFPGVCALDRVDIAFEPGEVHCIVGENGAGKSTLIKCLTGVYTADEGDIFIEAQSVKKNRKLFEKIAYVPQEIDLFKNMSVAENLFIPFERAGIRGPISQKKLCEKAVPLLEELGMTVEPETLVKDIPVSQQQLLQIARATAFEDYQVLMLDEPTTSLTDKDTEHLFSIVEKLKKEGKAVIFISHKLDEVFRIGDCISVFCNGKKVSYARLDEVDVSWVVAQMTGRSLDEKEEFSSTAVQEEVLLNVKGLTGDDFSQVSFSLRKGEILGFAGLVGAGRSELMQAVFGYLPVYEGSVEFDGKPWRLGSTHSSVEKGMFYLPEERRSQGILSELSVRVNASVNALDQVRGSLGISTEKEKKLAEEIVGTYEIKTPDLEQKIKFLSGGNQQKAIIGRCMKAKPKLLIFDEPTKGIDIGTKVDIYRLMKRIAEETGAGIILVSSEMDEVLKCSNRIIAMYNGRIAGEFEQGADKEEIMQSIFGLTLQKEELPQ
ncbi:MAG: sugar ABC transporter ATP-binding protein [Lachnospiraceae bacterium]|nr:sugar ABC transporter ATP-binding protein [Lachnospiraceae bacterium]